MYKAIRLCKLQKLFNIQSVFYLVAIALALTVAICLIDYYRRPWLISWRVSHIIHRSKIRNKLKEYATLMRIYKKKSDDAEIMARNPESAQYINKMDKIRQEILEAEYREKWRSLIVTYIFGPTASGKTRYVMETHGYGSVYRVTDYDHPFDRYAQEPVLCLDEFRSNLQIGDMLDYLDGYPLALPARYANRQACYETVYIISNIDLKEQYISVQKKEPETWQAFLRRIHQVIEYQKDGPPVEHGSALKYIYPLGTW